MSIGNNDEKLVQEIVDEVLTTASMEDDTAISFEHSALEDNKSTHTAIEPSIHNEQLIEQIQSDLSMPISDMTEDSVVDNLEGNMEMDVKKEVEHSGNNDGISQVCEELKDLNMDSAALDVGQDVKHSALEDPSAIGQNEVLASNTLEPQEANEDKEKENDAHQQANILQETTDKGFEPITPPVIGVNSNHQEEHQLQLHEQQQQLFNVAAPEKLQESDKETIDVPFNKANGGKADGGDTKENGTSPTPQGKTEPKTNKTKFCAIL